MKKIICMMCMVLMLCGCQQENIENIELSENYTVQEQIYFEVIKTEAIQKIEPSNKNMVSQTLEAKENHMYVDVLLKTVNLSQEQLKLNQIFSGRFEINNISYDLNMIMETSRFTGLTTTDTLKQNEERYVHLYCEIPKDITNKEVLLYFQVMNQQNYQYHFLIEEETKINNNNQSIGDVLSLKQSQITLNKLDQSKKIEPSNKGLLYSYIPVDNQDETYIYLQIDINNISNETIDPKEYIYCEYHVDGETIHSQIIIESENHKSLSKKGNIEMSQTRTLYLAMSVKDTLLDKQGYIELFVEGETFHII